MVGIAHPSGFDPRYCFEPNCASCRAISARERVIEESEAERQYDADRWSA